MQVETLSHDGGSDWSKPFPVALDGPQTLVLALGASSYRESPHVIQQLRRAFPQAVLAGCSTAGEVFEGAVRDGSVSVAVARFERTSLSKAVTTLSGPSDSFDAGVRLARQLDGSELRAVFVLSDGLLVNGAALVEGLNHGLPAGVSISGGLAGDGDAFRSTWVLDDAELRSGCIVAVGFYGSALKVGLASGGGWNSFGPERQITRAEGQVLYELDGQPALDLYKSYLGKLAAELPGAALRFPLSVKRHEGDTEPLVRTILGIDEASRSLTFAGDLPQGGIAQLMRASNLGLIESAEGAISEAIQQSQTACAQGQALLLSVSCIGRRMILGEHTEEELEFPVASLPNLGGHVGFYSYGEIAPAGGCDEGGDLEVHMQVLQQMSARPQLQQFYVPPERPHPAPRRGRRRATREEVERRSDTQAGESDG